ncbi:MAG: discoidin domain-containing protein [Flavisolibacter sp.]
MFHKPHLVVFLLSVCLFQGSFLLAQNKQPGKLTVQYLSDPLNSFLPDTTLGACYDGHEKGENSLILQPGNIKAMQSVDLKPLTYRLRTELAIEAWHWNPKGKWSGRNEGYWTSSSDANDSISVSYGYRLPRRGNTGDQANNDGYSRIDDGDETTFWKSNPYLDSVFTGESNTEHAQWVIIDLGKESRLDAISIHWGNPFATEFTIDYAVPSVYPYFENSGYYEIDSPRLWKPFPNHAFRNPDGSNSVLRLSKKPVKARFIRIRMTKSTALHSSYHDVRDSIGFAIREVYMGVLGKNGKLKADYVHHSANNQKQSMVTVSSNDPWHRAIDLDTTTEQVGIDRLFHSGLNNNLPVLVPTGVLYDIPENSLALVDYLHKKQYPVAGIELGEEPDGQNVNPEDYGALYHLWIKTIVAKYPHLVLGGPSLQTLILNHNDEMMPTKLWMQRFLGYLQEHGSLKGFRFFSFEWYPFDEACDPSAPQLQMHPPLIQKGMQDLKEIPQMKNIPIYISEYGYSAFDGINDVQIQSALMNADIVGQFLTLGGSKAYLYGLEPKKPDTDSECAPGSNMILGVDDKGTATYRTSTYYGAVMMKKYWATPSNQVLKVYSVTSNIRNRKGEELVSAYALLSPDSTWSLMIINKDPKRAYKVNVEINKNERASSLHFPLNCYQYSGKQYHWLVDGENSRPSKSLPPEERLIEKGLIELPPYSLTVIKEHK